MKQFEEPVVDLDSGETINPVVKGKKKYPNRDEIYTIFKEAGIPPKGIWYVSSTQMKCAENLSTERTTEQIKNALQFYKENQEAKYCPTIRSPFDLDSKWDKLTSFKKRL